MRILVLTDVATEIKNERVGVDCRATTDGSDDCDSYEWRNVARYTLAWDVIKAGKKVAASPIIIKCKDDSGSAFSSIRGFQRDLEYEKAILSVSEIGDF